MPDINSLRQAGFSDDEINNYVATQSQTLISAGFSQDEIAKHFGMPYNNTSMDGQIRTAVQANLDRVVKERTGEDGTHKPLSFQDAVLAGYQSSVVGLASRQKTPDYQITAADPWYNSVAASAAQMVGDVPAMLAGAVIGGASGAPTGPVAAMTAMGGAFALPAGLRAVMMDAYGKGEYHNFQDFFSRASGIILETAKGYITGAATGGVGNVVGKAVVDTAAPVAIKSLTQMGAELGTMVTVGKGLEGEVPTAQDFVNGAILLGAGKATVHAAGAMRNIYAKTGIKPDQVIADAKADPTIIQDMAAGKDVPKAYEDQVDPIFKQENVPNIEIRGTEPEPAKPAPEPGSIEAAKKAILDKIEIGGKDEKVPMTLDKLYTKALDDLAPIKKAVDAIAEGKDIPATEDPYVQARLTRGVYGKAQQFIEHSPFKYGTLENEGKSLKTILDPVKDDLDGLRAYAAASRAIELESRGIKSGFDLEASKQVAAEGKAKYESAMGDLVDYQNRLTAYLRDAGVLDKKSYDAMLEANKSFVPFYRVFENSETGGVGSGAGLKTRNPIKAIKGSGRDIIDPLESIIKNTYTYITLAERNGVAKSFYDLASKSKDPSLFYTEVPASMRPVTISEKEMAKFLTDSGVEGVPQEVLTTFRAVRQPLAKDEIGFFEKGKWKVLKVEPELAEAFKATDSQGMSLLTQMLSYPAKALRAGATLTPDFMLRNVIRDQLSAFTFSKSGNIPFVDMFRGAASLITKDADFQNWLKSGGANAAMVSLDRQYIQTELYKMIGEKPETNFIDKTWNVAKKPVEWLRIASELAENATRLGEFKKAAKSDSKADLLAAGLDSREVTLDFARVGTQTRAMNMITAFFNAQVQGIDRAVRAIKENPVGTMTKIGAGITLPSVLLWMANHDDPRYKELPGWQRDLFWIVMTEDHIYRIPKPFELGIIFGSGVERMLDALAGQMEKKDLKEFLLTTGGGLVPNFIPTAMSPVLEQITNHSFFSGHALIPSNREKLLPEYQYTEYTSELTKAIGHIVGYVPGVGKTTAASPMVIDNYLRAWTGGLGTYALQLSDAALRKAGVLPDPVLPESTLADIPVIKAFVIRNPSAQAESIVTFREEFHERQRAYNTFQALKNQGDMDAARRVLQMNQESWVRLDDMDRALSQQSQLIRNIYKNPNITPDQKRQNIDSIYYNMIKIAQNGRLLIKQVDAALGK